MYKICHCSISSYMCTYLCKSETNTNYTLSGENEIDPYLLEGFEAVQALDRVIAHGELYHHEIPHVRALLANQKLRIKNGLHANKLGSIRLTSPWKRA